MVECETVNFDVAGSSPALGATLNMRKKLYSFYCCDCDNAWMEISGDEFPVSTCEYCRKTFSCEDVVE